MLQLLELFQALPPLLLRQLRIHQPALDPGDRFEDLRPLILERMPGSHLRRNVGSGGQQQGPGQQALQQMLAAATTNANGGGGGA